MIESILHRHLEPIIERRRSIRESQVRTGIFLFVATLALIVLWSGKAASLWWLPIAGFVVALPIGYLVKRRPLIDVRQVAREIEASDPELKALLLTAVEEEEKASGKQLSFMQQRLVEEAAEKAIASQWRDTMDGRRASGWNIA